MVISGNKQSKCNPCPKLSLNSCHTLLKPYSLMRVFLFTRKRFSIACVSCPTLFQYLHKYLREFKRHPELPSLDEETAQAIDIKVFEYDSRFNVYGQDFVFYDYKHVRAYLAYWLKQASRNVELPEKKKHPI